MLHHAPPITLSIAQPVSPQSSWASQELKSCSHSKPQYNEYYIINKATRTMADSPPMPMSKPSSRSKGILGVGSTTRNPRSCTTPTQDHSSVSGDFRRAAHTPLATTPEKYPSHPKAALTESGRGRRPVCSTPARQLPRHKHRLREPHSRTCP